MPYTNDLKLTSGLWLANRLSQSVWVVTNKLYARDQSSDSSIWENGCSARTVIDNDTWMLVKMNMLGLMLWLLTLILILIIGVILKISASCSGDCLRISAAHKDFFKSKPLTSDDLLWPHDLWDSGLKIWKVAWWRGRGVGGGIDRSNSNRIGNNNLWWNNLALALDEIHTFSVVKWCCIVE